MPSTYRLPAETHIGAVRLQVSDLERSVGYYRDVIGFRVLRTSGSVATLGAHGHPATLLELHEKQEARAVPRTGLLGLFHFAILYPDRASLGRFLRHLAEIGAKAAMSDHLVSEALYLQDPDNLGIEVYADRPRSTWRMENGQLAMATLPLDSADLIAAARPEPFAGAPAGTTIGHVHLHVGDIEQAERFYHHALGFDKTVWSYPGALFLSAGGYHHHLGTNTWARHAPAAGDDDAKLLEWELVVPRANDVDAVAASVSAAGEVRRENGDAVASDPWGTRVRVTIEPLANRASSH
ncbi:MAG: VOC family protein [Gemmatimonadaceae bacterium]